jgi:cell division protein FtsL
MRHGKRNRLTGILKVLSIFLLILSIFTVVWMRSSLVSLEYKISNLEAKKTQMMKEKKKFIAERAALLSIERFEKVTAIGTQFAFPDRVNVVYVKQAKDKGPYKVSLSASSKKDSLKIIQ